MPLPLRLAYQKVAFEGLKGVPKKYRQQIIDRIDGLRSDSHPHGSCRVKGATFKGEHVFRERSGDYRVLYAVVGDELHIIDVGHRKDVYRR